MDSATSLNPSGPRLSSTRCRVTQRPNLAPIPVVVGAIASHAFNTIGERLAMLREDVVSGIILYLRYRDAGTVKQLVRVASPRNDRSDSGSGQCQKNAWAPVLLKEPSDGPLRVEVSAVARFTSWTIRAGGLGEHTSSARRRAGSVCLVTWVPCEQCGPRPLVRRGFRLYPVRVAALLWLLVRRSDAWE